MWIESTRLPTDAPVRKSLAVVGGFGKSSMVDEGEGEENDEKSELKVRHFALNVVTPRRLTPAPCQSLRSGIINSGH